MKKFLLLATLSLASLCMLASCKHTPEEPADPIEYTNGTSEVTIGDFTITAKGATDRIYQASEKELILISKVDVDKLNEDGSKPAEPEYTLTGTFDGQIINKTKATVLNLNGVTLTNTNAPAIYGEKKIELSPKKKTTNTITVTGDSTEKVAAVYCKKAIEIGGSGTLNISGNIYHGVKGGDVKLKGSLTLKIDGIKSSPYPDGSAINCETLLVEEEKTFTATLKNYKHAIKADKTIDIASGTFNVENVEVLMKTETVTTDPDKEHHIKISGGTIKTTAAIAAAITTDEGKCDIAEGVIVTE